MPIYEYRCSSCGHQQEFLQKVKDAPLTECTQCGKPTFSKMVTAAGFQLKGSGWYATDFKGSGSRPKSDKAGGEAASSAKDGGDAAKPAQSDGGSADSKGDGGKKASAGSCGGGCSCH